MKKEYWDKNTDVELLIRIASETDEEGETDYIITFGGSALTRWRFRSEEDAKEYIERHKETVIATIALILLTELKK